MKINEQPNPLIRQAKVRKQLSIVNWRQLIDRLNLYNRRLFDDEIKTISAVKSYIPINHRQRLLLFNLEPCLPKLKRETNSIG